VNRKRVQRLYRDEGLAVRRRGKRQRSQSPRPIREPLGAPNQRWTMDFVSDTLSSGRRFRCSRCWTSIPASAWRIHVAHSIPAVRVIEVLQAL
jgi:putative transposase